MDVQKYYSDFLPMHSKMKTLSCTGIGSGASSTVNLHLTGNRNKQESQVIESYLRVRNQKISGCHSGVEELCRNFKYCSYVNNTCFSGEQLTVAQEAHSWMSALEVTKPEHLVRRTAECHIPVSHVEIHNWVMRQEKEEDCFPMGKDKLLLR